ncbi:MAG: hypothetical protein ACFFCM_10365 [Promethearchaeota archaeon]
MGISQEALKKKQKEILDKLNNCKHEWKEEAIASTEDNEAMFSFFCEKCELNITIVELSDEE